MSHQTPPAVFAAAAVAKRDALIEQHHGYVRALAIEIMQRLPVRTDLEELVAYGHVGLVEAAERYDPLRGVAFTTFAYYRVRGAIYDGLRQMGHLSRGAQARLRFAANAGDLLQAAADDAATRAEVGVSVDDEIATVQSLIDELIPAYLLSLSSDTMPDIPDPNATSIGEIEQSELIRFVLQIKKELPEDEQQLLDAIYFKHIPAKDVAANLGISKSWISRLHARAIKHLRERMAQRGMIAEES